MRRPTINDIAREAGVSRGAVSFALNDRPGVSEATRERVKQVAAELGWTPSPAALALSSRRARALGLVIARDTDEFAGEGFFLKLIGGIERVLQPRGLALVLQIVPDEAAEQATYRAWWAEGRVDGVLLLDPRQGDARPAQLGELGLPGVLVGGEAQPPMVSGLVTADAAAMAQVVEHLHEQGHRHVAYVVGLGQLLHTCERTRALGETAARHGMRVTESGFTDFTEDAARRETSALLAQDERPTAIIYDNEVLAMGGLAALHRAGLSCPDDVAVVSFEDSPLCRAVQPGITALVRDPALLGTLATQLLLEAIDGAEVSSVVAPAPVLEVRESSVLR